MCDIKYNKKLIKLLAEEYCPNDLGLRDYGMKYCHSENGCGYNTDECVKCWTESLERMEKHRWENI